MRAAVVGLGLIGGSTAMALQARGYDRAAATRARARERGIDAVESLSEALSGAEVVVIAVSTEETPALLVQAAAAVPSALLTDVASLKRPIAAAAATLPATTRFVAGHPMAGSKTPGIEGARPDLFRGRPWLVVPTERSGVRDIESIQELARGMGADPAIVEPERHDALMTWVSHLPLAVSSALARSVSSGAGAGIQRYAGSGLLDATRLADTPAGLARELALADPEALSAAIEAVRAELEDLAATLRAGDAATLEEFFEKAARARRALEKPRL
jgi:prephenate dehydrogenase